MNHQTATTCGFDSFSEGTPVAPMLPPMQNGEPPWELKASIAHRVEGVDGSDVQGPGMLIYWFWQRTLP